MGRGGRRLVIFWDTDWLALGDIEINNKYNDYIGGGVGQLGSTSASASESEINFGIHYY